MANSTLFAVSIRTQSRQELQVITEQIQEVVRQSDIQSGVCYVSCPHTTAALTINSYLDPATALDLRAEIDRLIPTRVDFHHIVDTPSDASAHIKASLIGGQLVVIVDEGRLLLGDSQGILFWEFDGPRSRKVQIKVIQG
jgi:secondary thiamine-phosphate synthase enzyme